MAISLWKNLFRSPSRKRQIIGVQVFSCPTEFGVQLASDGLRSIITIEDDLAEKLAIRSDTELKLNGELVNFYRAHFGVNHAKIDPISDRCLTDAEWVRMFNEKFGPRNWKCSRYSGQTLEYVIVTVFS